MSVDGQRLEPKFGRFYDIKPGAELRTDEGRAEVLLTPGVFLRVDQNSSIRMVSNRLTDTRVEFVGGSASLDSSNAAGDYPLTIAFKGYQVKLDKAGQYRFNSAPAELRVDRGEAQVVYANRTVLVHEDYALPFAPALTTRVFQNETEDGLDRWAKDRSDTIAANNASAAASDDMTAALDNGQAGIYDSGAYPYSIPPYSLPPAGDLGGAALASWGLANPYGLYGGSILPYAYIPLYRGYGGINVYRPISPLRTGTYHAPAPWRPPSRVAAPIYHAPMGGGMAHPIGHAGGHR